jgi:hypothetical protein
MARPTYSLALGVVPLLFLIATRATDPAVCGRAVGLLKVCNRREGFWDSRIAAMLAERIFAVKRQVVDKYGHDSGIELKLLDISFLPGTRCVFRYRLDGPRPGPAGDDASLAVAIWAGTAAGIDNGKEYYEQLEWEG